MTVKINALIGLLLQLSPVQKTQAIHQTARSTLGQPGIHPPRPRRVQIGDLQEKMADAVVRAG